MVKLHTNKIRRLLKKERLNRNINDLEKELWYDIQKAKSNFMPSHTKLKKTDGSICTCNERQQILADPFEHNCGA